MNLPDICTLVPHAGPMILLDRVIAVNAETLCAEVTIGPNTLFCDGQGVGAWVGVEYMAQAIAAYAGYAAYLCGNSAKVGFLLGSRRYECSRPYFALGSILHVHVQRVLQNENGLGAFECRIDYANDPLEVIDVVAATATITVFQPENVSEFLQEILE
ncbi:MAG: 3-hydroxylacyl-ACP dehydratase [Burkholderiaceae bacterium]